MRHLLSLLFALFLCAVPAAQRHNVILQPQVSAAACIWQGRPAIVMAWQPLTEGGMFVGFEAPASIGQLTWQLEMAAILILDNRPCAVGRQVALQSWEASPYNNPTIAVVPPSGFLLGEYSTFPHSALPTISQRIGPSYGSGYNATFWQLWYRPLTPDPCGPVGMYPEICAAVFFVAPEVSIF